jgi:hypothetical protein
MLRRQQIVEGAVGMVEHALDELASKEVVVLCSETETQPIR